MPKLQINPDLIWRELNDEIVIVSPPIGEYCVLNGMGSVIWQLLTDEHEQQDIEVYLVTHFDVTEEQARQDVDQFLADLHKRGMILWAS